MKKSSLFTSLFFTTICITTLFVGCDWGCKSHSGGSTSSYYPLPGEDTIYLTPDTMCVATVNAKVTIKNLCVFYPTGTSGSITTIDTLADELDTISFRGLYNIAAHLGTGTSTTSRMVTVLQIKYGIHNNKVKLYYKPLCLAWTNTVVINGVTYNQYANFHSFDSNYYTNSSSGLVRAGYKLQFQPDSANYVNNILIRHQRTEASPTGFNWAPDSTGDLRSGVYPFQEIFAMNSDNHASDSVKMVNIGLQVLVITSSTIPYIKHGLVLGPKSCTLPGGSGIFCNMCADAEAVCPPNCAEISYRLIQNHLGNHKH